MTAQNEIGAGSKAPSTVAINSGARLSRFAPGRNRKVILSDLAKPGDWALWAGYWWEAHHFNRNVVVLRRPAVRTNPPAEYSVPVSHVQRWVQA